MKRHCFIPLTYYYVRLKLFKSLFFSMHLISLTEFQTWNRTKKAYCDYILGQKMGNKLKRLAAVAVWPPDTSFHSYTFSLFFTLQKKLFPLLALLPTFTLLQVTLCMWMAFGKVHEHDNMVGEKLSFSPFTLSLPEKRTISQPSSKRNVGQYWLYDLFSSIYFGIFAQLSRVEFGLGAVLTIYPSQVQSRGVRTMMPKIKIPDFFYDAGTTLLGLALATSGQLAGGTKMMLWWSQARREEGGVGGIGLVEPTVERRSPSWPS